MSVHVFGYVWSSGKIGVCLYQSLRMKYTVYYQVEGILTTVPLWIRVEADTPEQAVEKAREILSTWKKYEGRIIYFPE